MRERLTAVPTGFTLAPEVVSPLIEAGQLLLRRHPEYQRWLQELSH